MKILLIGSGGQLATDLKKVIPAQELVALSHQEIDVTKKEQVEKILSDIRPDIVINTAAYHKVDECENNEQKCFEVNATAVKYLIESCNKIDATLVHFSTDYVFGSDQKRKKSYTEKDCQGPVNVYGISKLAGEKIMQYLGKKYFIIRVCGLFGVAGSSGKGGNFVETMIRLAKEKGEVKVVNDQILTPTYTMDVAQNVYELIKTKKYGLYHMTSEGQCSWYEFANKIFELMGLQVKCEPTTSEIMKTVAQRPLYSVLENANLKKIKLNRMSDWQTALKKYLIEKGHITA